MARYIDKFRDELMDKFLRLCNYNDFSKLNLEKIADTINEIYDKCVVDTPTADVVEVVRCKDCKRYIKGHAGEQSNYCDCHTTTFEKFFCMPNDYCSCGERKCDNG